MKIYQLRCILASLKDFAFEFPTLHFEFHIPHMYDILTLNAMKVAELKSVAENLGIANAEKLKKQDLVLTIMDQIGRAHV